ncbi:hypothetical protein ACLMAL_38860 [Nocardia sp. CWNU-33]|uniref:hypothetical protein n=1 Tax=Nocardia sp. CWNU-33 TaxID=3392117 RepID=UPI00398E4627
MALELVGRFAKLQETIDALVALYFQKRTPGLFWYLKQKRATANISDSDRPKLLLTIADDLQAAGDRSAFSEVFVKVKVIRDYVGHGSRVETPDPDTLVITKNTVIGFASKEEPDLTVRRDELAARLLDLEWLMQHVLYVMATRGLVEKVSLGDHEVRPALPPGLPSDWDGSMWESGRSR